MTPFDPPIRALMGPGPSDVHPRVLAAMARPTVGHLDPIFQTFMDELKALLRFAFRTDNELTIPLSAPGSAGMETCFVNLLEPGDTVVVCENGVFGTRMRQVAERIGARPVSVVNDWGATVDVTAVADTLAAHPEAKALAFVHAETSTGARADAETLCALARQHGCLTIVDAVTSLAGVPLEVDGWGIDAVYAGSQKCLSCPPGLAPLSLSPRAAETVRARKTPVASWFLDLRLIMEYWGEQSARAYHHTAPVNALYGLHEALLMLKGEGLKASWLRHARMHRALAAGIEAMGLAFLVDERYRLPQLNAIKIPHGVDADAVRRLLLARYGLEIGAGLGPLRSQVWRIGLMGHSARLERVVLCLTALEEALAAAQVQIRRGAAVEAALVAAGESVP